MRGAFIKGILISGSLLFMLTGCIPILQDAPEETDVNDEVNEEQDVAVIPPISTVDDYYQSVLYDGSYLHGSTRGYGPDMVYNRLDLDHLEVGLTRVATEYFDNNRYFFREGQFVTRTELNNWLRRYDEEDNPLGLNPALAGGEDKDMKEREEEAPRFLSHILEHNYLVENDNGNFEVGGIVIGISLNDTYHFSIDTDEGRYLYDVALEHSQALAQGKEAAELIVSRLRDSSKEEGAFNDIPIIVALFQEEARSSAIPGSFVAHAVAEPNEGLSRWQDINEQYYLFPSSAANSDVRNDADQFNSFKEEIQNFFENFVGVHGRGFYNNNKLQELTIEIPLQYQGKTEIVALTQFAASEIKQRYDDSLKVNVYIHSVGGQQEAVIIRNPNEEPFIHVYQ
ncbi:hypothetical protein BTS2_2440 [Bacillus sp. TS-2]|nr:hypothetical protein BTS2_2440 [Bacillus sp. TS-2]